MFNEDNYYADDRIFKKYDINYFFNEYIKSKHYHKTQDMLTVDEFRNMHFEHQYPEIFKDLLYLLIGYRLKQPMMNEYYDQLEKENKRSFSRNKQREDYLKRVKLGKFELTDYLL